MGRGTLGKIRTGGGTLEKVQDGSVEPRKGPRRVGGPSWRSETSWWTHLEFLDGSEDPPGGSERVRGPSGRSGTGQGTL